MSSKIRITRSEEAEALWVVRDRIRFLGEEAGSGLALLEVEVPPGSGTPPHRHASPEIFRVLAGEVTFGLFGEGAPSEATVGAGTVVTVPSGVPHSYRNASAAPASLLVVVERPMVDFFRDLGRREAPPEGPPGAAEIAAVMAACARHGITILDGPPA
jgi:quercetin dioxygenase-like cupin family protein